MNDDDKVIIDGREFTREDRKDLEEWYEDIYGEKPETVPWREVAGGVSLWQRARNLLRNLYRKVTFWK